jgi:nitrous oxidase accessory protein NosD
MKVRLLVLVGAIVLLAGCTSAGVMPGQDLAAVIAAADPGDRIVLAAGTHRGPIVIDKPLTLIGRRGAVVTGPEDQPAILITNTEDVTIRNLTVEGGYSGIDIRDAVDVLIDRVTVTGALWHGIFAHDVQVTILDCSISGLTGPVSQGIEIINSDSHEESVVQGCTIVGPMIEGIVSHVSHVRVLDNVVTNTSERAISVTEMSAGTVEGNHVHDVTGAAYYCGDMSMCTIVGNSAAGVEPGRSGTTGDQGHAVLIQYHSMAFVEDIEAVQISGEQLLLMLESFLVDHAPYPLTRP